MEEIGMFEVNTIKKFYDLEEDEKLRHIGDKFVIDSLARFKTLSAKGLVEPIGIRYRGSAKKSGKDIYVFAKKLYFIGGIETSLYNLVKTFEKKKITVIVEDGMNFEQALRLSRYCNVKKDTGEHYKCNVALLEQYDTAEAIIDRLEARKIYHQCHADWLGMKAIKGYQNMQFIVNKRVDSVLAVSDTCKTGLKEVFGYDSEVVPNILADPDEKPLSFLCLSRKGTEKGWSRVVNFAKACEEYGNRDFVVFATSDAPELSSIPEIVQIQPNNRNKALLYNVDYLLQLSENESYCYSAREALQLGVPVIGSKIPELKKLIKNGKNGYLVENEPKKAEIEKIFAEIPKPTPYSEPVPEVWKKVLSGEL